LIIWAFDARSFLYSSSFCLTILHILHISTRSSDSDSGRVDCAHDLQVHLFISLFVLVQEKWYLLLQIIHLIPPTTLFLQIQTVSTLFICLYEERTSPTPPSTAILMVVMIVLREKERVIYCRPLIIIKVPYLFICNCVVSTRSFTCVVQNCTFSAQYRKISDKIAINTCKNSH